MELPRSDELRLDRRAFLLTVAAAAVVASCSSDNSDSGAADGGEFQLIQRFAPNVIVPGDVRLPFSLSDARATFVTDGPETLSAQILDSAGSPYGSPIEAVRRDVTPAPYYAFRALIETPGIYTIVVDGGPAEGANFEVLDPSAVNTPAAGTLLPGFETPTTEAPAGVDPICTRDPFCDFHSITLTQALTTSKAVAYYVGTPASCSTGSCTPALEALIEVAQEYADRLVVIHAEVFTDLAATKLAPAVEALDLGFEPTLFITDTAGTIVERLDAVWEASELRERLELALA